MLAYCFIALRLVYEESQILRISSMYLESNVMLFESRRCLTKESPRFCINILTIVPEMGDFMATPLSVW